VPRKPRKPASPRKKKAAKPSRPSPRLRLVPDAPAEAEKEHDNVVDLPESPGETARRTENKVDRLTELLNLAQRKQDEQAARFAADFDALTAAFPEPRQEPTRKPKSGSPLGAVLLGVVAGAAFYSWWRAAQDDELVELGAGQLALPDAAATIIHQHHTHNPTTVVERIVERAAPGPRGLRGAPGPKGLTGKRGATGRPGRGRPGRDGRDGRDGNNGLDRFVDTTVAACPTRHAKKKGPLD